jgi:hypothetical protein
VIDPEVDSWVWGSDNSISEVLGWREPRPIRTWLVDHGYQLDPNRKPLRPKEALESVMAHLSEPRSSILYEKLISKISLERCVDPAFKRLRETLQSWFPALAPSLSREGSGSRK